MWCSVQLLKKRSVMFTANSTPPKLTFCPDVKASPAATNQNTDTTLIHTTDRQPPALPCDCLASSSRLRRTTICRPASTEGSDRSLRPSRLLVLHLTRWLAPVSKERGSRLACTEGNSCDNNDKDFFERTPHQPNLIIAQQDATQSV